MQVNIFSQGHTISGVQNNIIQGTGDGFPTNVDITILGNVIRIDGAEILPDAFSGVTILQELEFYSGHAYVRSFFNANISNLLIYGGDFDSAAFRNATISNVVIDGNATFGSTFANTSITSLSLYRGVFCNTGTFSNAQIQTVLFPEGVTTVSSYVLKDATITNEPTIDFPKTLRMIEKFAFQNVTFSKLGHLNFPVSMSEIGYGAFEGAVFPKLLQLSLPSNTILDDHCLRNAAFPTLQQFAMGANVTYGASLFDGVLIGNMVNLQFKTDTYIPVADIAKSIWSVKNNLQNLIALIDPTVLQQLLPTIIAQYAPNLLPYLTSSNTPTNSSSGNSNTPTS